MPRLTTRLTDTEIKNAKPRDKEYSLADGAGLSLRVKPNGSKLWIFNFTRPVTRKRANMGFGQYPALKLKEARQLADDARELLAVGIDPQLHRSETEHQRRLEHDNTLEKVATEWLKVKRTSISDDQAEKLWRRLELHVLPSLGKMPITKLTRQGVIRVIRPIEAAGSLETVRRLCQIMNQVMIFAANLGLVESNNLDGIGKAFQSPTEKNMATIKPERLPELMKALATSTVRRQTQIMIEWQIHTLARPGEAAKTRWEDIDLEKAIWRIPAEHMKMRREHMIPLTPQSLALLKIMHPISGHREFVFPGFKDPLTHANTQSANMALKRLGFKGELVSHGLRSLASTTLNEQGFDPDLIEYALAHQDKNDVRAAYNRAEYLERRRVMMNWWSKHIDKAATGNFSMTGYKALNVVE